MAWETRAFGMKPTWGLLSDTQPWPVALLGENPNPRNGFHHTGEGLVQVWHGVFFWLGSSDTK